MLIGYGEDSHRLAAGRRLVLGGVEIAAERGAVAHSDGDALLHALTDALLSSLALGDIGALFPDDDAENRARPSTDFLERALAEVRERGYEPQQLRAVVVLDRPRLGPYREAIQSRLSELLGLEPALVGLTFKTSEGLAPDHVQARAVVTLVRRGG
ncbi:2-C-methyl-D-erythritol 2,4-cyclodiphosphate synthase [Oceanithermus sp.]